MTLPLDIPELRPLVAHVHFDVIGRPAPQGSKKAFINPHTGRAQMKEQTEKTLDPWRQDVRAAAAAAIDAFGIDEPLDGPLLARMVFTVRKPSTAPKTRRIWPAVTPDLSKLLRSTEDAITSAGLWRDDARVVEYSRLAKVYPGEDPEALDRPGVRISIWRLGAAP